MSILSILLSVVFSCEDATCDSNICLNNGKIRRLGDSCYCKCPEDVSGRYCEEVDPCKYLDCKNGGSCFDGKCNCPEGYTGIDCSIEKDPCELISCANGGICVDGACSCPDGFFGAFCENSYADSLIGIYFVSERCDSTGLNNYQVTIKQGKASTELLLMNQGAYDESVITLYFGSEGISIPSQLIGYYGIRISGDGSWNSNSISLNIEYYDVALESKERCRVIYNRKKSPNF